MREIGGRRFSWALGFVSLLGACSDDHPPDPGAEKGGAGGTSSEAGAGGDGGSGGLIQVGGSTISTFGGRTGNGGAPSDGGTAAGGTSHHEGGASWHIGGAGSAGEATEGGAISSGGTPPIGSGGMWTAAGTAGAGLAGEAGAGNEIAGAGGVGNGDSVSLDSAVLNNGLFGAAYRRALSARGGSPRNYQFSIASGSLPNGLRLSRRGLLNGVPQQEGAFEFEVAVTDSTSTAKRSFHLEVERHRWACLNWADEKYGPDVPEEEEYFREYLELVDTSNGFVMTRAGQCSFSPEGKWFIEGAAFRSAVAKTPGPQLIPEYPSCNRSWAPQERRFACVTATSLDVIELSSAPTVVQHALTGCTAGTWSTSGKRLTATCAGTLRVVNGASDPIQDLGTATWSGWVTDDVLLFKASTGALMSVDLSQSPVAPQVRLENATGLGTTFRVEADSQRVLFVNGSAPLQHVFLDLVSGYNTSQVPDTRYSQHLDYYVRDIVDYDDPNLGLVEVYATASPGGAPVVSLSTAVPSGASWSDKGTVLITRPREAGQTRFTDFEDGPRSREVASTFQLQGWGEEGRWLLGYAEDKEFILDLVPTTPTRTELWSDSGGSSISRSRTAVRTQQSSVWTPTGRSYPCVVSIADAGPSSPSCLPSSSDPSLDVERWPLVWSSDSSSVFVPTRGYALPSREDAAGMSAIGTSGAARDLVQGWDGLSLHTYAQGLSVQP